LLRAQDVLRHQQQYHHHRHEFNKEWCRSKQENRRIISMPFYLVRENGRSTKGVRSELLIFANYVHEHNHEQQVDEVHRLDQSDGQEKYVRALASISG